MALAGEATNTGKFRDGGTGGTRGMQDFSRSDNPVTRDLSRDDWIEEFIKRK